LAEHDSGRDPHRCGNNAMSKKEDAALFAHHFAQAGDVRVGRDASPFLQTIAACLTPPGRGAIATLGLCGPRAWDILRELFHPRASARSQLPADPEPRRVWLGRLGDEISDEVIIAFQNMRPVPRVDVHCHGGGEVVRLLLELFAARGLRVCSWQEFQQRTSDDRLKAAAAIALADAATVRTAGILLDQYQGALSRAVQTILASWEGSDPDEGTRLLQSLLCYAGLGRRLTCPWRLVVAGAPNVGKSSLINALAGYPRCVVAPTPGTTRDVVTTRIAIDGWPVELVDTAGLRTPAEALEEEGIHLARLAIGSADLCLWVLDASAPPVWPDSRSETVRFVVNKVDLKAAWDLERAGPAGHVSALQGSGLSDLCDAISGSLVPNPPPPGAAVPFTAPLAQRVEEACHCCAAGKAQAAKKVLEDLVSGEW
jgi:tRNA modification GTPase